MTRFLVPRVGSILSKQAENSNTGAGHFDIFKWIRKHFTVEWRVFVFPMMFLVCYYIIQLLYQFDVKVWCSVKHAPLNLTEKFKIEACRKATKLSFEDWGKEGGSYVSLITFLLGFYVSNVVSRWNQQVSAGYFLSLWKDPFLESFFLLTNILKYLIA